MNLALKLTAATGLGRASALEAVWTIQGWGLLAVVFLSFFPRLFHLEEYLFYTLLILGLGVAWAQQEAVWVRTPIDLPVVLLVAWILLTVPFATDPAYSFAEWRKLAGRFLVFYWALLVLRHHEPAVLLPRVLGVVALACAALAGYGLWHFLEAGGTLKDRGIRALAPSSHSHWLATYMVVAIPMLLACWSLARAAWRRALIAATLLAALGAELVAFSRGGWLSLGVQALAVPFLVRRRAVVALSAIMLILLLGMLIAAGQAGYLRGVFDSVSVVDRLGCWQLGLQELIGHPVFGRGFGNDTFVRLYPGDPPGACSGGHLHNTFLMFAMGSGVPALLLLLWVFAGGMTALMARTDARLGAVPPQIRTAVCLALLGFGVSMCFNYLFTGSLAYLLMALLAVGLWPVRPKGDRIQAP